MKIIVTGGGTAGHVTPLLAVVSEIRVNKPAAKIRYIGQFGDKSSKKLVHKHGGIEKQHQILAGKLRRFHGRGFWWYLSHPSIIFRNLRDIIYVAIGFAQSFCLLIAWRPNVVFIKGGYVGLPVGLAAGLLRVPIITHDSDTLPGLTNRIISRFANKMAVAMPPENYKKYYDLNKVVETGVPIEEAYFNVQKIPKTEQKKQLGYSNNDKIVVLVGGSLGASRLNKAFIDILPNLLKDDSIKVLWATGKANYGEIKKALAMLNLTNGQVKVEPFFDNLAEVFWASDVVISRAGATTLAELAALGAKTVLVPNPVLTGGHQLKNAEVLERSGAAVSISESQLEENNGILLYTVRDLLAGGDKAEQLSKKISELSYENSAKLLATEILNLQKK